MIDYKRFQSVNIINKLGSLSKLISKNDKYFNKFGEAYLTKIKHNKIKGWKLHKKMISNIFLIKGKVEFVIFKDNKFHKLQLNKNYNRIFINKNTYFAFKGLSEKESILINFSSIVHDKNESETIPLKKFNYKW
jgi:dTDP-4-dehydrorhamnose 3,5-epimerase